MLKFIKIITILFFMACSAYARTGFVKNSSSKNGSCNYKSASWSQMFATLKVLSKDMDKVPPSIRECLVEALAGSSTMRVDDFEFHYVLGKSVNPTPNQDVCYSKTLVFYTVCEKINHECKVTFDVNNAVTKVTCVLIAG